MINARFLRQLENIGRILSKDIHRDFRHVSFIVRRNNILAIGTNHRKTHPEAAQIGYRYSEPHSELSALLRIPKNNRRNLTLVNFRFNKNGELRQSRPCEVCANWCKDVFESIYHSTDEGIQRMV